MGSGSRIGESRIGESRIASSSTGDTAQRLAPQGRHRDRAALTPAEPAAPRATSHARPTVGPDASLARPPIDLLADTGPGALRAFNLGTIPASVTPPRTWRRAALFAVLAAVAALAGLVAVSAMLVGPVRPTGRIEALPNFPRGVPLATVVEPSSTAAGRSARPADRSSTAKGSAGRAAAVLPNASNLASLAGAGGANNQGAAASGSAVGIPDPGQSGSGGASAGGGSGPTVTTVSSGRPAVDPNVLVNRTQTFFAEVTSNARAAARLTVQTVRDDAVAVIDRKYGNVSSIELKSISLDPSSGVTVDLLRVVHKDGTTTTDQTTLQFTLTGDPKIVNPGG